MYHFLGRAWRRFGLNFSDRRVLIPKAQRKVVGRSTALKCATSNRIKFCQVVGANTRIVLVEDVIAELTLRPASVRSNLKLRLLNHHLPHEPNQEENLLR